MGETQGHDLPAGEGEQALRMIITGGTFDKEYDALKGELSFSDSHLPGIMRTVRCTLPIIMEINQLTDSLDMTEEDRATIADSCADAAEKLIVITHGTDTMTVTAELLAARNFEKTIVLTGAMVPYSVRGSDALFNLGCAISAVQTLGEGVYICMNGRIFPAGAVRKDRDRGVFVDI
jgi:L-asparaginase